MSWLLAASLTGVINAQCQPQWLPGDGFDLRGGAASDAVHAIVEMPNGDLVVGGQFTSISGVAASNVARWNGATWSPLGSGIQGGVVRALAVLPGGDLVAGGLFTTAGGVGVDCIARWDGAVWSGLGTGITGTSGLVTGVLALAVLPTGDLVAGGHFTSAGGGAAMNIARWSAGAWSAMGAGLTNPPVPFVYPLSVTALTVRPNGTLVAGTDSNAMTNGRVEVWNGAAWSPLPYAFGLNDRVFALASLPNNDLLVGHVTPFGYVVRISRWNGAAWTHLGLATNPPSPAVAAVRAIAVLGNGDIVCGGAFTSIDGVAVSNGARWNGVNWSTFGGFDGEVSVFTKLTNGFLVAGGSFGPTSTVDSHRLARRGCGSGVAVATQFGRGCYWRASSFYESFLSPHALDLSQSTLRLSLTPTGYDVTHVPGSPAWTAPASQPLALTDDSVVTVPLTFSLPYPGGTTTQVTVGSNGCVFLQPSTSASPYYSATAALLANGPRVAAYWGDLDPAWPGTGSGTIHFEVVGQTAYATWLSVQEYGASSIHSTLQIAMSSNGTIECRYQQCDHQAPVLTGWSPGLGATDPTSRDLSAYGPFSTTSLPFRLPLVHVADQRPKLGTSVTLTTSQLDAASVLGLSLIGFTKFDPGIELSILGMPACYLFTSLDLMFPFFPVAQSGSLTVAIPNQASLIGVELHAQGVAWDFPVNAFGMVSSNGLTLTIGNP